MPNFQFYVALCGPDGEEIDVTDRVEGGGLNVLTESVESTLTQLTHGDLSLTLDDRDGYLENIFTGVTPDDLWTLLLWRRTARRRNRWELIFGGVFDLPWSLNFDLKGKTAQIQVFSYSKLLEKATAEDVKRTLPDFKATTSVGSNVVVLDVGTTADLVVGDEVTVNDYAVSENHTIKEIIDGTTFHTDSNWGRAFDSADLFVDTPYYRNKTIWFLIAELFKASRITDYEITEDGIVYEHPLAQPINTAGLPSLEPISLLDVGGSIRVSYASGTTVRKEAANLVNGFTNGPTGSSCEGDWWPYVLVEPGTRATRSGVTDNGAQAWGAGTAEFYYLNQIPFTNALHLKDGGALDFIVHNKFTFSKYTPQCVENGVNGNIWVSYKEIYGGEMELGYYNIAGATWHSLRTDAYGQLRVVTGNGFSQDTDTRHMLFLNQITRKIEIYGTTTLTTSQSFDAPPGDPKLWTFRWFSSLKIAAMLYHYNKETRLRTWSTPDFTLLADYQVSNTQSVTPLLTGWTDAAGNQYPVGHAGGTWFVLSTKMVGVVPYADFTNVSCGAAMKDLALVLGGYVDVDPYKIGKVGSRVVLIRDQDSLEVDDDVNTAIYLPVWENYRSSVQVSGPTPDAGDYKVIAGATGDSARRESISAKIPMIESMGLGLANSLYLFSGKIRTEVNLTLDSETEFLARVMKQFFYRGTPYVVSKLKTTVPTNEQEINAFEVVE